MILKPVRQGRFLITAQKCGANEISKLVHYFTSNQRELRAFHVIMPAVSRASRTRLL
jgi:hypothetical protein